MGLCQSKGLNSYQIMGKRKKIIGLSRSKYLKFMIYTKEMRRKIMGLGRSKGLNLYQIIWEKEEKSWG